MEQKEAWTGKKGTGYVTGGLRRGEWVLVMAGKGGHRVGHWVSGHEAG